MHPQRKTVVVLGGGVYGEHDVSCASARDIAASLDRRRFDVVELRLERDGSWSCGGRALAIADITTILARADVAVPAFHGAGGEDGTVAGLLELVGVPYVGAGVAAGAFGMDKRVTKLMAGEVGVATAAGLWVTSATDPRLDDLVLPLVVKPNGGGSSHGLSLVRDRSSLGPAIALALEHDDLALVEEVLVGREIDVGVLELPDGSVRCSPPLEILTRQGELYDTAAKYDGKPIFSVPAAVAPGITDALHDAARLLFRALGCRGLARVDFFYTADGVVLNEVNTFPGFTDHSQFPRMFEAAGIDYPTLVETLLETALSRKTPR